jgi:hypothetical protein
MAGLRGFGGRSYNLYPERATTREMLDSAGVTVQALGLENGDQELIDLWRAEDDSRP